MSTSSQKNSEDDSHLPPAGRPLKGYQRKYLRALAHALKPVLLIGQRGVTPMVVQELSQALDRHELVKIKFIECKVKRDKQRMAEALREAVGAHMVGLLGHTAIFFRSNPDPDKRTISLPQRSSKDSDEEPIPPASP